MSGELVSKFVWYLADGRPMYALVVPPGSRVQPPPECEQHAAALVVTRPDGWLGWYSQ